MGNGAKLKKILDEKGVRVSELSKATGIPPTTLYGIIKRDNKKIDSSMAMKIADALSMDLPELIAYLDSDFLEKYSIPAEGSAKYDFSPGADKLIIDTIRNMEQLNDLGKEEAAKRVYELTLIDKYRK